MMHEELEKEPVQYMSMNGFGRTPMLWGVPYMAGLGIVCASLLPAMVLGTYVHASGWLFVLIALPLLLFAKEMCRLDDKALQVLAKEVKWSLIRLMGGNTSYYDGMFTISPISYGRKQTNVERGIEASIRG
jgi:type IV secretion system protein VirB3